MIHAMIAVLGIVVIFLTPGYSGLFVWPHFRERGGLLR